VFFIVRITDPSELACFSSLGWAPLLVYVRTSNACPHLPVLSEGAGIVSTARIEGPPFYRGASASTETSQLPRLPPSQGARSGSTGPTWASFQSFLSCAFREQEDGQATLPIHLRPRVARAQWAVWLPCVLRAFRASPNFPNDPISFIRTLHASGVQQSHLPIPESPFLQHCSTCNRGVIHV
jgi:hypothetical protein